MKVIKAFFYKDGEFSKTASFLTLATFILLGLWVFQSLFAGNEFGGWWTLPEFNVSAGVTILFTLSALYVANHKLPGQQEKITPEQFGELRNQVGDLINAVSGRDKDDN